jgi:hypothetical protein
LSDTPQMTWIRGGALASIVLAAGFALLRRWKTARLFAAFAVAFADKWRETRLASDVQRILVKAGRDA